MKVVLFKESIQDELCLALGFFDGVHRGHRELIKATKKFASENNCASAISTFADKPNKLEFLQSYNDRKRLLVEQGISYCLSMYFCQVSSLKGNEFFDILLNEYKIKYLICGEDYTFGNDRLNVSDLQKLCDEHGIKLVIIPAYFLCGIKVSSTGIKTLIKSGKLDTANNMLGTPFHITGTIVKGHGIGRHINMPTMNVNRPEDIIPLKLGVYGTSVLLDGKMYDAVTNYGDKPTFDLKNFAIESHLIGYDGESQQGSTITIYFKKYLRSIRKFKSATELVEQVNKDMRWLDD